MNLSNCPCNYRTTKRWQVLFESHNEFGIWCEGLAVEYISGDKKFWAYLIRRTFKKPTERKPCVVCGKYKSISEAHHAMPVAEMVIRLDAA